MITSEMFIERLLLTKDIVRRREAVVQAAEEALQPLNETGILDMFGNILHSRGEIIERFRLPGTEYLKEEGAKATFIYPKRGDGVGRFTAVLDSESRTWKYPWDLPCSGMGRIGLLAELESIEKESIVLRGSVGHISFGPANYPNDRRTISYEMQRSPWEISLTLAGSIGREEVAREPIFYSDRFVVQNAMQRICGELKLWPPHRL